MSNIDSLSTCVVRNFESQFIKLAFDKLKGNKKVGGPFMSEKDFTSLFSTMLSLANVSALDTSIVAGDGTRYQLTDYKLDQRLNGLFDLHRGLYVATDDLVSNQNCKEKYLIPDGAKVASPSEFSMCQQELFNQFKQFATPVDMSELLTPEAIDLGNLIVARNSLVRATDYSDKNTLPIRADGLAKVLFTDAAYTLSLSEFIKSRVLSLLINLSKSPQSK